MTNKGRKRKDQSAKGQLAAKGKVVERITAMMHEVPGVRVEPNVSLPAIDGSGRAREFDVVLRSTVAGYGVRFAIQCKNYAKPIGVQKVDEFVGALNDVGIPTQHAIYVSVNGYTGFGFAPSARTLCL